EAVRHLDVEEDSRGEPGPWRGTRRPETRGDVFTTFTTVTSIRSVRPPPGSGPYHRDMQTLPTEEQVRAALGEVIDPEIRRPITDLGMVESAEIKPDGSAEVTILLTVAGCPMRETLTKDVTAAMRKLPGVTDVKVTLGVMSEE